MKIIRTLIGGFVLAWLALYVALKWSSLGLADVLPPVAYVAPPTSQSSWEETVTGSESEPIPRFVVGRASQVDERASSVSESSSVGSSATGYGGADDTAPTLAVPQPDSAEGPSVTSWDYFDEDGDIDVPYFNTPDTELVKYVVDEDGNLIMNPTYRHAAGPEE